jgi:lysozyme family protein
MEHPFLKLQPEYTSLLGAMVVEPAARASVDRVATKIIAYRRNFQAVQDAIGIPIVFSGPSFYREASLNFNLSPAQGDPWRRVSVHVPKGLGPYPDWQSAAIAAYKHNGLDKVGAGKWTWELVCFYAELFNGFGYRDYHHEHSPYLWGGTNIQQLGKYTSDGKFEEVEDSQLGVIPIGKRIAELATDLNFAPTKIAPPIASGLATSANPVHNVSWLQGGLKELGFDIDVDNSYGIETKHAVAAFEHAYHLAEDGGYAGDQVLGALEKALAKLKEPTA